MSPIGMKKDTARKRLALNDDPKGKIASKITFLFRFLQYFAQILYNFTGLNFSNPEKFFNIYQDL